MAVKKSNRKTVASSGLPTPSIRKASKAKPAGITSIERDEAYDVFEQRVREVVALASANGQLFTTDADPVKLWEAYLAGIPSDRRQHYNCNCCRRFIQKYGGLVTLSSVGTVIPAIWTGLAAPLFFAVAVANMLRLVARAQVTGMFLSDETTWGIPRTGEWSHLSGSSTVQFVPPATKTCDQVVAEKREDFRMLTNALTDFDHATVAQALRILKADAVVNAEKTVKVAEFVHDLQLTIAKSGQHSQRRANLIWKAVAVAPPGFCHVRSSMIGTLLEDLVAGLPFEDVKRRWASKMHPLAYQRPQVAPKAGAIDAAERIFEQLGLAPALNRRYATLDDVLVKRWVPRPFPGEGRSEGTGVFSHLRTPPARAAGHNVELPPVTMTQEKFFRTVMPEAFDVAVRVPATGSFYGLLTATDPNAPPILQWDGLTGYQRNPVSWYFNSGHVRASDWNLTVGTWARVTAIFDAPHQWQQPGNFSHQHPHVFLALEHCRPSTMPGLALFPECVRGELREVRSVIEAHSNRARPTGVEYGNANGIAFQKEMSQSIVLRVQTPQGTGTYTIDRRD